MRFTFDHVDVAQVAYEAPEFEMSSSALEDRLAPLYERLSLVPGRLQMMTGIETRRFWKGDVRPSDVAARAGRSAIDRAEVDPSVIGALAFCSVCRDQVEPASAHAVHHGLGLGDQCQVFDVSNACLGLLNGMAVVANMIELGQIESGLVVGGEDGWPLVDATVRRLCADEAATRRSVKADFASLTVGSGAAAVLLARHRPDSGRARFRGGVTRGASEQHRLCVGGVASSEGLSMATDAEALLEAGLTLAKKTYADFRELVPPAGLARVVTHQVSRTHHVRLLDELGIDSDRAFTTFESFGNVGSVSLPLTWARAREAGFVESGQSLGLLGIGSGLACMMAWIQC